jgi:hypothetical protein
LNFARPRIYAMGEPPRQTPAQREAVLAELRRRAWRDLGLAIFDPADIADDWLRQAVRNEAERQYGGRR